MKTKISKYLRSMEKYLTLQRELLATKNVFINTDLGEEK